MRTTVSIDDELLLAAKRRARERAQTLGDVIDDALRRELADTVQSKEITVPVFSGQGGLRLGIDAGSNQALLQALDEDQPIDALR